MSSTRFVGPGIACGIGFAIALQPDEKFTRFNRMMDFVIYKLEGPGRAAVIYEGNAPQDAEMLVETGRDFPSVVALHLGDDGYDSSLAGRILTKRKVPRACLAGSAS